MFDENSFNFGAMKEAVGVDPFAQETTRYAKDERFYTLTKNKDGDGGAVIRFLPDSEKGMIQRLFKINTTITINGKKRFVSQFSPATIGAPCPFQETWQELWNAGDKDGAKQYGRGIRYIANIKVLKDPANPENEGKIFMYEMSGAMKDKIQGAVDPSEQDRALGAQPKELFNPLKGNSFRLIAKKGANGQINYDSSEVLNDVSSIYDSVDAALDDIKNNTHTLSDLLKPESFMSYDELVKKKAWVTFQDQNPTSETLKAEPAVAEVAVAEVQPAAVAETAETAETTETTETMQEPTPAAKPAADSLDSLLDGLV